MAFRKKFYPKSTNPPQAAGYWEYKRQIEAIFRVLISHEF